MPSGPMGEHIFQIGGEGRGASVVAGRDGESESGHAESEVFAMVVVVVAIQIGGLWQFWFKCSHKVTMTSAGI